MACCRSIEHEKVCGGRLFELLHLAEHEDVADTRNRRGHHVEGAAGHQPLRDAVHPGRLQILHEGLVRGEGPGPDLAHAAIEVGLGQDHLVIRESRFSVHRGQARLALHLDNERCETPLGGGPSKRGRNRGFAHSALARNDDKTGCSEELRWIHPSPLIIGFVRSTCVAQTTHPRCPPSPSRHPPWNGRNGWRGNQCHNPVDR